ncbi:MAG: lipase maturation factor family protein [Pseudomonadota bacterium]|nr:lipase maturation factor family protein [Pseudomonadota bacterium]
MNLSRFRPAQRWKRSLDPDDYRLIIWLFPRLLALIYLAAFASLGFQIVGLVGENGILPLQEKLAFLSDRSALERFLKLPTLFWINAGDGALRAACVAGCVFSLLLFFGVWIRASLIALFVLFLSVFHAGQIFLNFQWDYLLLEAGFLAIFLDNGSRAVIWMYRWLLFRLRLLSGLSKVMSGDESWSDLTALNYYFEVQPLPHSLSWYAHQLPDSLLKFATGSVLFIEIVVPFMMLLPRGPRLVAAWLTLGHQGLILLTSNHSYVNPLVILLCLFLFDDRAVRRAIPEFVLRRIESSDRFRTEPGWLNLRFAGGVSLLIFFVSTAQSWEMIYGRRNPEPVAWLTENIRPFRLTSRYHVFPTMKTDRIEILIEGSIDGEIWRPYRFRYKPEDPDRAPRFIVPHQPRLDWMMWFVPMHPVFLQLLEPFLRRLQENSGEVVGLLEENPFPETGPRYLRINAYQYRFTDPETRKRTGLWWEREDLGPFWMMPRYEGPIDSKDSPQPPANRPKILKPAT